MFYENRFQLKKLKSTLCRRHLSNYFLLNKATKRDGREKIHTKTVTAIENAAIKG